MSLDIKESLKRMVRTFGAWIKEDIDNITQDFDGCNALIAILYFGSFFGLILSVCLMGVDGDIFWGIVAFIFAIVVMIIGFTTGAF